METITAIEEVQDRGNVAHWSKQDGFLITTTEQEIWLGIDNGYSCCEQWGYLISEDDTQKFIGAELRSIATTDTNRTSQQFNTKWEDGGISLDDGEVVFVDLNTSEGTLQFAAYNSHNGYYGHTVTIKSKQLNAEYGV